MNALDVIYVLWSLSTLAWVIIVIILRDSIERNVAIQRIDDRLMTRSLDATRTRVELLEKLSRMTPEDRAADQAAKKIANDIEKDLFVSSLPKMMGLSEFIPPPEPAKTEATTVDALKSMFDYYDNLDDLWIDVVPDEKPKKSKPRKKAGKK